MADYTLSYPDSMLPELRYRYCPMCTALLTMGAIIDSVPHASCPSCGWVYHPATTIGVVVVVRSGPGIVFLYPPGLPAEAPSALPFTHCEYGETPEEAATRVVLEATGLEVEIVRSFGSFFSEHSRNPGPTLTLLLEARVTGGRLNSRGEGKAAIFPPELFPAIAPQHTGSLLAWQVFLAQDA